jgi:hypothetical protein
MEEEAATRSLAELTRAHDALSQEHLTGTHALSELSGRHRALQQDRQFAADQLEAVLRRFKP